ncbi:hypothetical protein B0H66DRAFT_556190 [Apodospora peruviana]|uniref:Nucleoporin NUP49/NSP49 n=1 Tax=Apodospora peruviana TaxID=516989 RepID=A0AAE0I4J6_9PEZI|nr:hypothetical protein B0H66DRAFT_556190 [Apodospora peruviana]
MALARSASGPGGLSINTGAANIFGGTNSTQAPAAGGGLFGGSATASQPAQSTSLFGTATSQPQTTGSLFNTASTNSQPQQGGGLFGTSNAQTTNNQQQQPPQLQIGTGTGTSLFGQTANTQNQQQPQQQPQQQQQQQPQQQQQQQQQPQQGGLFGLGTTTTGSGGGLFGNTNTAQPQQMNSLFGGTAAQPQQQQTGGLFGGLQTQTQPTQTGGLFGASTQQQQQQQQQPQAGGGLFGGSTAGNTGGGLFSNLGQSQQQQPQQANAFGQTGQTAGLTLGQSTNQQQQVVPGVRIDLSNIRSTTRFNDLQEDLQKQIAQIDEGIQKCIRDKEAVDAFLPSHGDQVYAIPADVSFVTRKSEGAHGALSGDVTVINQLRDLVKKDAEHAKLSFKAIDNLKLPTQYHQAGLWSTTRGHHHQHQAGGASAAAGSAETDEETNSDLITYFSKTADEMEDTMVKFSRNLGEIESHLSGVQGNMLEQLQRVAAQSKNGSQGGMDERVVELAAVLRDFEESILKVAGVVGGVKEGVTELQLKDFMGHGG